MCNNCHGNKTIIESFHRNKKKKLEKYSAICFHCNCIYSTFFKHTCKASDTASDKQKPVTEKRTFDDFGVKGGGK